jgi:S-adenosylmethionine-diacylgycerolhomoserine-N-methlytransferase
MSAYSSDSGANIAWLAEATDRMNRMYRRQRHIYNGTRRYYLLGRDRMIANLQPAAGASVLEIGCGTGRNLILAARRHPDVRCFGIDVSTHMLTSAISAISRPAESASPMAMERHSIRRSCSARRRSTKL